MDNCFIFISTIASSLSDQYQKKRYGFVVTKFIIELAFKTVTVLGGVSTYDTILKSNYVVLLRACQLQHFEIVITFGGTG